jgi:hypothetical protein
LIAAENLSVTLEVRTFLNPRSIKPNLSKSQPSTRSFRTLPALKKGSFFGAILTFSPVLGLRPAYIFTGVKVAGTWALQKNLCF